MSGQIVVYGYRNGSNLRNQDVSKEILSDLARKDVADLVISFPISSVQLGKCVGGHQIIIQC